MFLEFSLRMEISTKRSAVSSINRNAFAVNERKRKYRRRSKLFLLPLWHEFKVIFLQLFARRWLLRCNFSTVTGLSRRNNVHRIAACLFERTYRFQNRWSSPKLINRRARRRESLVAPLLLCHDAPISPFRTCLCTRTESLFQMQNVKRRSLTNATKFYCTRFPRMDFQFWFSAVIHRNTKLSDLTIFLTEFLQSILIK